jgi:hypothetical protein
LGIVSREMEKEETASGSSPFHFIFFLYFGSEGLELIWAVRNTSKNGL